MARSQWFDDLPVLGKMTPAEAAAKLREVGENEAAEALEAAAGKGVRGGEAFGARPSWWPFQDKPWQHTAHAFGYLAPAPPGDDPLPIKHAGNIAPDAGLKKSRIKITLNRLRIADYPGGGTHRVLFDFYAQNQVPGGPENLHFNATFRAREGQRAAVIGYPIFIGLGLDFGGTAMGARLAAGDYLAVQIPESFATVWDWSEWVYAPNTGQVVNKKDPAQLIPYNYIVFGVSRYEGE